MLRSICILLAFQLVGETLARSFDWQLPGPVVGFVGLFLFLVLTRRWRSSDAVGVPDPDVERDLGNVADKLLSVLGLLFVPAGVGIVDRFALFSAHGAELAATLVLSLLATLLTTVATFLGIAHLVSSRDRR